MSDPEDTPPIPPDETATLQQPQPDAEQPSPTAETEELPPKQLWESCKDLAQEPRVLDRFASDLDRAGIVGEERAGKLLYLAITTRFLDRPASVVVKGPSSVGKSYTTEAVLRFFPDTAYHSLTTMSEKLLAYDDEPLAHRILVITEAAGLPGKVGSYLLRSLLSEGRIRYKVVEKSENGRFGARLIEREGPTGLILTTTRLRIHPENETRVLSIFVDDSANQTRQIMLATAEQPREAPDFATWHTYHNWLALQDHRVLIPYAGLLAEAIPAAGVRLRRDFGILLSLITSHALLHQANRDRDSEGRIIATLEDYAVVRDLIEDLLSEGLEARVPRAIRETVKAVNELRKGEPGAISIKELAAHLGLDRTTVWRRLKAAIDADYLQNHGEKAVMRVVPRDPLPADRQILPAPGVLAEALARCNVAAESKGEEATGSISKTQNNLETLDV